MHLVYLPPPLIATWRSGELDRHLAAGVDPRTSGVLTLRARKLTGRRSRKHIAAGLARVHRRAQNITAGSTAAVRPNVGELPAAQTVLAAIDRRLRSSAPVGVEGVAMLHALLTDAASPLYQSSEPGALASHLRAAAAALERTDPRG